MQDQLSQLAVSFGLWPPSFICNRKWSFCPTLTSVILEARGATAIDAIDAIDATDGITLPCAIFGNDQMIRILILTRITLVVAQREHRSFLLSLSIGATVQMGSLCLVPFLAEIWSDVTFKGHATKQFFALYWQERAILLKAHQQQGGFFHF